MKIVDIISKYKKKIEYRKTEIEYYRQSGNEELRLAADTLERDMREMELILSALEKQIPKKLICETVDENEIEYEFEHYGCPNCKNILHQRYKKSKEPMKYKQNYCHDCGQKLDWG